MKNINKIHLANIISIYFIYIYSIFCLFTLSNSICIGKYPYLKKLNNNRYILISTKGITFLDSTLTISSNTIEFDNDIYSGELGSEDQYSASTIVVQFPDKYNNLIVALIVDKFYFFNSDEILLNDLSTIDDFYDYINWEKPYYLMPYKYINGNYIISMFSANYEDKSKLYMRNIFYNNETNTVSFSEKAEYILYEEIPNYDFIYYNSIACELIENGNSGIIYCFYGIENSFKIISFDPDSDDFSPSVEIFKQIDESVDRYFYKSINFQKSNEILFCSNIPSYFECIKYNTLSNTYINFFNFSHELTYIYEYNCKMEYFEESKQIIISLFGISESNYEKKLYIVYCNMDGTCSQKNIESISGYSLDEIFESSFKYDLVIPFGKLSYNIFAFIENTNNYFDLDIPFELICEKYYNYNRTYCLTEIPEGFYLNDTNATSIDKCHKNCKTCQGGPIENNNNCLTCNEENIYYDLGNCRNNCLYGFYEDEFHKLNCHSDCQINNYLKNECNLTNPLSNQDIINDIRNLITNNENNDLLFDIINNELTITKIEENMTIQIISIENQIINNDKNISIIDLGDCENNLKQIYNIENTSLLLYKVDVKIPGYSAIKVQYELYNPNNFTKLNLEYCKNSSVNIKVPAFINNEEIYKYDPKSDYYNNMCFPNTNENEVDKIILDRKNEFIDYNMSLCDSDCTFNGYDSTNHKALCKCNIKYYIDEISHLDIDSDKFFKGWVNIENIINIKVLKCYKLLNTKEGFLKNIGNFILLSIIILFIGSAIYFYFKGFSLLQQQLLNLKEQIENDINVEDAKETNKNSKDAEPDIKLKIKLKKKKRKNRNTTIISNSKKLSTIKVNTENKINAHIRASNIIINNNISVEKKLISENGKQENNTTTTYKKNNNSIILIDYELNSLTYKDALEFDKRTYCQYYLSLIKSKQLIVFTFYFTKDYNSYIIKIQLFLFSFALFFTVNALFFNDSTIHQIYENDGIFNFVYNIPQIIYSTIISALIDIIVKKLSLTEKQILEIKLQKSIENLVSKYSKIKKCLKLKFILFYIISILFLAFFWFYLACFCAVYTNTQKHLIKDTLLSFALSLLYPFILNVVPMLIRIPSLKNKNKECMYKVSKIAQLI